MAPARHRTAPVTVVGAGVFGAWIAWHLKKAGKIVRLIDQYGAGHARSSSGGESRVIRISYGGDPLYSKMSEDALTQWAALSRRQTQPILHRTGVLWFSPPSDSYMKKSLDYLAKTHVPHQAFSAAELAKAYPQIAFQPDEVGFLETHSGALSAGRGVQAVVQDAKLKLEIGKISAENLSAEGIFVFACGPWLAKIFPEILKHRITPTRQEVYHFGIPAGEKRFSPGQLPTWADFNNGELYYGMPDLEGQGFKIAYDPHGEIVDPDTLDRRPSAAGVERARAYLAKRFPLLTNAPLIHARVCQYENSSNGDFLIDRHPDYSNVWLVGAGSGHGFKHGPAVGRLVTEHILNPDKPIEPRFSLATKQTVQNRAIY